MSIRDHEDDAWLYQYDPKWFDEYDPNPLPMSPRWEHVAHWACLTLGLLALPFVLVWWACGSLARRMLR